jgi:DnaJ-class molecular chaperone
MMSKAKIICPACAGFGWYSCPEASGTDRSDGWYKCDRCGGAGTIEVENDDANGDESGCDCGCKEV